MAPSPIAQMDDTPKEEGIKHFPPGLRRRQVDVFEVLTVDQKASTINEATGNAKGSLLSYARSTVTTACSLISDLRRFLLDVYKLGPQQCMILAVMQVLLAVLPSLKMYSTNRLLLGIEDGMKAGKMDVHAIRSMLFLFFICTVMTTLLSRIDDQVRPQLQQRVDTHFEYLIIKASLSRDYAQWDESRDPGTSAIKVNVQEVFQNLDTTIHDALSSLSELAFLLHLVLGSRTGPTLLFVWGVQLLNPLDSQRRTLMSNGFIYRSITSAYIRLRTMVQIAKSEEQMQEVLSGNLASFILDQHVTSQQKLGDINIVHPLRALNADQSPLTTLYHSLMSEWPTQLYVAHILLHLPPPYPVATAGTISRTTRMLEMKLRSVLGTGRGSLVDMVSNIRHLYQETECTPDPMALSSLWFPSFHCVLPASVFMH